MACTQLEGIHQGRNLEHGLDMRRAVSKGPRVPRQGSKMVESWRALVVLEEVVA